MLNEGDIDAEEVAKLRSGEQIAFGAVRVDTALFHHDDAVDFRKDIGQVVGDHENADTLLGDAAESLAEFALSGEIEGVGRLIEEEHFWLVNESTGNHNTALLACGHFANQLGGEVIRLHQMQGIAGTSAHFGRDVEIGPESRGGEESGNISIETTGHGGAFAG